MIVYGSQALRIGLEKAGMGFPYKRIGRPDLDVFATEQEAGEFFKTAKLVLVNRSADKILAKGPDGMMVEIEIIKLGTSTHLYWIWANSIATLDKTSFYGIEMEVAPLEMLFSIAKGCRHTPRKFHQHVKDYNFLREILGGKDVFERVTNLRYEETKKRDGLKTPSLMKSTQEFFDDSVSNKTLIHDQIHEVMAHGERPMFEKIKVDPNKVTCSKDRFMTLSQAQRRQCVQEEAYVIALERAIIPMLFENGPLARPEDAYRWAVMRICTNLTSGWFREWALENYDHVMFWYNPDYVEKFLKAVESGRIKRIER